MPVKLADCTVQIQGDMAVATATAIVVDDKGAELSRETVTAQVNKDLRADDPARRGLRVDAKDRLAELLAAQADAAEAKVIAKAAEVTDFSDVQTLAETRITRLAKLSAEPVAREVL